MINLKNLFHIPPPPPIFGYLILSSLIKPVLANFCYTPFKCYGGGTFGGAG